MGEMFNTKVQYDPMTDEYFIEIPDDIVTSLDLSQWDKVEWIDNEDGTFTIQRSI